MVDLQSGLRRVSSWRAAPMASRWRAARALLAAAGALAPGAAATTCGQKTNTNEFQLSSHEADWRCSSGGAGCGMPILNYTVCQLAAKAMAADPGFADFNEVFCVMIPHGRGNTLFLVFSYD